MVMTDITDGPSEQDKIPETSNRPTGSNVFILEPVKADEVLKRGRPKTKVSPSDVYTTSTTSTQGSVKAASDKVRILRDKKKEIEDTKRQIVEDLNDSIIEVITTIGIPEEFLYKGGRPPVKVNNSKYTELGNAFIIQDVPASWMAHGYVEAKELPALKKLLGANNKEGPSYFWMGLGALGLISYITSLVKGVNEIKKISKLISDKQIKQEEEESPNVVRPQFNDD